MRSVPGVMILVISLTAPDLLLAQAGANTQFATRENPLVGVWAAGSSLPTGYNCLRIIRETDGTLDGSSFGVQVRITQLNTRSFTLEFNPDSGLCCPRTFNGHLSKDRAMLSRSWQEGPNQVPLKETWRKVRGISNCQVLKVAVAAGVAAGMLKTKIDPVYPAEAFENHVSGTVVLHATISTTGCVEALHVITGPHLLQQAALDAVRQWTYRPYLLNNIPVVVETTINVVFAPSR